MASRVTAFRKGEDGYAGFDERLLVLDFQAGNPEAFVEIHRRYGALAKHVCRRFLPNGQDADEAFQETMIRVFQGLFRFNGQYALQPWIARIATNVSLDQIRSRGRRPQLDDTRIEEHEREDPRDGPDELVERLLERDLVIAVLADLPETHRTALVLRELEGRSHKEIAAALGTTPTQAKALIHRAKGSFRRAWLKRMADRGGLAGIAFLPLLWLSNAAIGLRRVAERASTAGHIAQAATPEIVSTTTAAGTSAQAISALGERVVAAGMTLLLAGGVTVGAATIVRHGRPAHGTTWAAAAEPSPTVPVRITATEREEATRIGEEPAPERVQAETHDFLPSTTVATTPEPAPTTTAPTTTEPSPVVVVPPPEDTTSPSPEPPPSPEPSPTPDPTTEPSPTAPPPSPPASPPTDAAVPTWSFAFSSSASSAQPCDCDASATRLGADAKTDPASGLTSFTQDVSGVVRDAKGDPAWRYTLTESGSVGGGTGRVEFRFTLTSASGNAHYAGMGTLTEAVKAADGASTTYRFSGSFEPSGPDPGGPGFPAGGDASLSVSIWADGTVYAGAVRLSEVPA